MDEPNFTQPEQTPPEQKSAGPATHGSSPSEPANSTPRRDMLGQTSPRRIMQPSASFVREMQHTSEAEFAAAHEPARQTPPSPTVPAATEIPEPRPTAAIHHEAIAVPPPAIGQSQKPEVPDEPPEAVGAKAVLILAGIYTLGALLTLSASYTLYAWAKIGIHSIGHGLGLAISLLTLIVGIGLLRRKDIARATYIFIAIIGLALSLYGSVRLYNAQRSLQKDLPVVISQVQASQDTLRSTSDPSDTNAQKLIAAYDQQIADLKGQQGNPVAKTASALSRSVWPYYLSALLPLAFLMRPSVKAKFR